MFWKISKKEYDHQEMDKIAFLNYTGVFKKPLTNISRFKSLKQCR